MLTIEERLEHLESILQDGKIISGLIRDISNLFTLYQDIAAKAPAHHEGRIAQLELRCSEMRQRILAHHEGRIAQLELRCSEMRQRILDHDERLDELSDDDEPDLSPEEQVSLDELAGMMGMPPVEKSGVYERATALCAAYYDGDVPGDEAWERVARESRRLEDDAINRAIDQGLDHCATIRRLQAELAALKTGDGVPRVSVVAAGGVFNIGMCSFCTHCAQDYCPDCDIIEWIRGAIKSPIPSHFELREDLR